MPLPCLLLRASSFSPKASCRCLSGFVNSVIYFPQFICSLYLDGYSIFKRKREIQHQRAPSIYLPVFVSGLASPIPLVLSKEERCSTFQKKTASAFFLCLLQKMKPHNLLPTGN